MKHTTQDTPYCSAASLAMMALGDWTKEAPMRFLASQSRLQIETAPRQILFIAKGALAIRLPSPLGEGSFFCQKIVAGDYLIPECERLFENVDTFELVALEDTSFHSLPEGRWKRRRADLATHCRILEDALFSRVAALRREVARIGLEADQRFIHYLLTEQCIDPDGTVLLDSTYQKAAMRLHLAHPTLSRMLKLLEEQGVLTKQNRLIHLRHPRRFTPAEHSGSGHCRRRGAALGQAGFAL